MSGFNPVRRILSMSSAIQSGVLAHILSILSASLARLAEAFLRNLHGIGEKQRTCHLLYYIGMELPTSVDTVAGIWRPLEDIVPLLCLDIFNHVSAGFQLDCFLQEVCIAAFVLVRFVLFACSFFLYYFLPVFSFFPL